MFARARPRPVLAGGVRHRLGSSAIAVALGIAVLAAFAGPGPALDRFVRKTYFELRGERTTHTPLLFVAIDDATVASWGPPPWSWGHYQEVIRPLREGGARLVAVIEHGQRVILPGPIPDEIVAGVADGWLVVPTAESGHRQPTLVLDPRGSVEAIELGDRVAESSILRDVIERLGGSIDSRTLRVNFNGARDRLPTVPARHVAERQLPASTYRDRVIVIGLTGDALAQAVPTPVGAMSSAEVHAHAIHAVMTGAEWIVVPVWIDALVVGCVTLLGVFAWRRLRGAWLIIAFVVAGTAVLWVGGYLAFSRGDVDARVGGPWLALLIGVLTGLVLERRDAMRGVTDLRRQLQRRLQLGTALRTGVTEAQILDAFADALRTCLPLESCVWAELPASAWHLQLASFYEMTAADTYERRRDVRRDPWRIPYTSHRPEWANRPFTREALSQRSLIIPVVALGRLLGCWIANLPQLRAVAPAQLRVLEVLADDLAVALSQQRLAWHPADERARTTVLGGALEDAVHAARHDTLMLAQIQDRTRMALEQLPIGVLGATSWGMIEHYNAAMTRFLAAVGITRPDRVAVPALIAELAGTSVAAARDTVRDIVIAGGTMRLAVTVPTPGEIRTVYDLVLCRVDATGDASGADRVPSALVLTASLREELERSRQDQGSTGAMGRVIALRTPGTDRGP